MLLAKFVIHWRANVAGNAEAGVDTDKRREFTVSS
jgi:hypothetical protein